jgi:methyl-accepting chemotaxis protein
MALDEADRFRITTKLADTLGQDDAAALMETIPPFDWHQIVTKTDLTNAVKDLATKSDMDLEFNTLREEMGIKFSQVDAGFARVDARFEQVDARFEQVDARFEQVDARFEQVGAGFARVDARFDQVAIRFSQVDAQFAQVAIGFAHVDGRFFQVDAKLSDLRTELHKTLRVHFLALITTMLAMNTMMVSIVALLR